MSLETLLQGLGRLPHLEACPDGAFTLKEEGRYVHSLRAPLAEARRLLGEAPAQKTKAYVLWGMGLGYHAQLLLDAGCTVIAVETRPRCIDALKKTFPLGQLHAFITENPAQNIFSALACLPPEEAQSFGQITMSGCQPDTLTQNMAAKGFRAVLSSGRIYEHLMDSWYCHILQNLSLTLPQIRLPFDAFRGQRVVICSAGPSLRESLPHLERLRGKYILLAVDTAFSTLVEAGIIPDFLHAVDAKIHNVGDFAAIPDEVFQKITLLADLTLSPIAVRKPWKAVELLCTAQALHHPKKGFYYQSLHLLQMAASLGWKGFALQTGGSVATSAFHYAVSHGSDSIYLVGQDLAYSNHRGHSVGTPYDREQRCSTSRLCPLDHIHARRIPADAISVAGIDGPVISDPLLSQFRSWFETSTADPENPGLAARCTNASEQGSLFEGWAHRKLSQLNWKEDSSFVLPPAPMGSERPLLKGLLSALEGISADSFTQNPLGREYLFKEYSALLRGETPNPALLGRKIRRLRRALRACSQPNPLL